MAPRSRRKTHYMSRYWDLGWSHSRSTAVGYEIGLKLSAVNDLHHPFKSPVGFAVLHAAHSRNLLQLGKTLHNPSEDKCVFVLLVLYVPQPDQKLRVHLAASIFKTL